MASRVLKNASSASAVKAESALKRCESATAGSVSALTRAMLIHKKKQPEAAFFVLLVLNVGFCLTSAFLETLDRKNLCDRFGQFSLSLRVINLAFFVLHGFLRNALGFKRLRFVEVTPANCGIRQHRHQARLHFKHAAYHENQFFLVVVRQLETHRAGTDAGQDGRVTGQDAQLTCFTWQRDKFRKAGKKLFLCTDDVHMNSHRHGISLS